MLRKLLLIIVLVSVGAVSFAQTPTPTITPTPTATQGLEKSDAYKFLATAAANLQTLPDDPSVASGVQLIPSDNGAQIFGYVKWLFSGASADELLGRTLSPIGVRFFLLLIIQFALTVIFFITNFIAILLRVANWIIRFILQFIPFFG